MEDTGNAVALEALRVTATRVGKEVAQAQKDVVMVSVTGKAKRQGEEKTRQAVDLVAVIDTSGSMSGSSIALAKEALAFMLQQAREGDRIAIITFADEAALVLPLIEMNEKGKLRAKHQLESLEASGGTNLSAGVFLALDLLMSRSDARPVTSIMLLSDGLSNRGLQDGAQLQLAVRHYIARFTAGITLFTFGLGAAHDAAELSSIAAASAGGVYSYLPSAEEIPGHFGRCLGGLYSVIAQNIRITYDASVLQPLLGPRDPSPGLEVVGDMFEGERKDILFKVLPGHLPGNARPICLKVGYFDAVALEPAELLTSVPAANVTTPTILASRTQQPGPELLPQTPAPPTLIPTPDQVLVVSHLNRVRAIRAMRYVAHGQGGLNVLQAAVKKIKGTIAYEAGESLTKDVLDNLGHAMAKLRRQGENTIDSPLLLSLSNQFDVQRTFKSIDEVKALSRKPQVKPPGAFQHVEPALGHTGHRITPRIGNSAVVSYPMQDHSMGQFRAPLDSTSLSAFLLQVSHAGQKENGAAAKAWSMPVISPSSSECVPGAVIGRRLSLGKSPSHMNSESSDLPVAEKAISGEVPTTGAHVPLASRTRMASCPSIASERITEKRPSRVQRFFHYMNRMCLGGASSSKRFISEQKDES